VGSAILSPLSERRYAINLSASPGQSFEGEHRLAELLFSTAAEHSETAQLIPHDVVGTDAQGRQYRGSGRGGEIFVIAQEPLLFAEQARLTVFGVPGKRYRLESTGWLDADSVWSPVPDGEFLLTDDLPLQEFLISPESDDQYLRVGEVE